MPSIGSHCILELYGCPETVLDDEARILTAVRGAAQAAGSTLLAEVSHRFDPQGVTALALLAESHISVHTWPELAYAACDVFTCGETCLPEEACRYLARALQAERYELEKVPRGHAAPPTRRARKPLANEVA